MMRSTRRSAGSRARGRRSLERSLRCLLAVGLAALASTAAAADDAAELGERLARLESMTARFTQTVWSDADDALQSSEGEMAVKRDNRLRWEIESPYAYLIVTDGSSLWRYDADLEQAVVQPFRGELANTPALIFSSDPDELGEHYRVRAEVGSEGTWYRLIPVQEQALFKNLRLLFADEAVTRLELVDNLDQRTEIRFHDVRRNPELSDALFRFEPPAGTDLIRNDADARP